MFCPECGKKLPDDSVYCEFCGSRTDGTQAGQGNPLPQNAVQQPAYQNAAQQPGYQNAAQQPGYQNAAQQPGYQNAVQQPAYQNAAQQPAYQNAAQQPAFQSAGQQPVRETKGGFGKVLLIAAALIVIAGGLLFFAAGKLKGQGTLGETAGETADAKEDISEKTGEAEAQPEEARDKEASREDKTGEAPETEASGEELILGTKDIGEAPVQPAYEEEETSSTETPSEEPAAKEPVTRPELDDFSWRGAELPEGTEGFSDPDKASGKWKCLLNAVTGEDTPGRIMLSVADIRYQGSPVTVDMDVTARYEYPRDTPEDCRLIEEVSGGVMRLEGKWDEAAGAIEATSTQSALRVVLGEFGEKEGIQYAMGDVYNGDTLIGGIYLVRP